MPQYYDYAYIESQLKKGKKLIKLCDDEGWDYNSVKNGLYRFRSSQKKVITLTQIKKAALKEQKIDPDNKEWATLIQRIEGRDQYIFRTFLKLVNKQLK